MSDQPKHFEENKEKEEKSPEEALSPVCKMG